jgi:hypothetical protein
VTPRATLAITWPQRARKVSKEHYEAAQVYGILADFTPASQMTWFKACVLGDSRQHPGANLLAIMECKDIVRIVCMFKGLVRS